MSLAKLEALKSHIEAIVGDKAKSITIDAFGADVGELTITVFPQNYLAVAKALKDASGCQFEQLMDVCGVDYSAYKEGTYVGKRYCVVAHLLSVSLNQRVRLRVFAANDDMPIVPSLTEIWSSANWFEREAFDLFGIVFDGHNDLRRILTDYGFIGHPFRKDFPTSGHVEMRYDEAAKRVVYQPVSIEPREITPRIIREEGYAGIGR
ncbi:MAG: NADH-quinone oxidoreductase subunit C [Cytophagales bacterium]|nr:NADH-quinone oxidoreductase subunit C [Cytophagales bacterium]